MRPLVAAGDGEQYHSGAGAGAGEQQAISVDSDMVVILASLLCAIISVVGLALVARCACRWPRQARSRSSSDSSSSPPPARGLKKKAIEALPTVSFVQQGIREEEEQGCCAICLGELVEGEELRVLPRCNHAFHVACIDTWLGAHASCPSCRTAVMVPPPAGRCRRCGAASNLDVEHADLVDV